MYYIVTGAAGFIGSNIVRALNQRGEEDIIAVDNLADSDKFKNLVDCDIADYFDKQEFLERLQDGQFDDSVDGIIHQGACSDTMETNGAYMIENNYRYSVVLLDYCQDQEIPFIYASSAAVYGASKQFREERDCEAPINMYAYSKFLFDQIVRRRFADRSSQIVGLRYFNVYGLNEAHKGRMASVAFHFFNQYQQQGKVKLFEGSGGYANGAQQRDFVSVEDVVKANLFFLDHSEISGLFNIGSGKAQSFNDVAMTVINTCRRSQNQSSLSLEQIQQQGLIEYISFPNELRGKYQNFTEADLQGLRSAGYQEKFLNVEEGVARYVKQLLR